MSGRLIFVTGGARSGKSTFAEELARSQGGRVAYVATALVADEEMARRVEKHRERRPKDWATVECTGRLSEALALAAAEHDVIVVDCLTVYIARLLPLLGEETADEATEAEACERMDRELDEVVAAVRSGGAEVIVVSNEVGSGLVPAYPSGRLFRDMVGRANQRMATEADFAYLVVAGVPLDLRALQATRFPWRHGD
ncbi:MAG: bifunctional adenosylcobinamide kinase/adenosylcobinamide-phosphate guanylyltransferase [Armatimonadia bacterium]